MERDLTPPADAAREGGTICVCGHDRARHDREGECLMGCGPSDPLAICPCDAFVPDASRAPAGEPGEDTDVRRVASTLATVAALCGSEAEAATVHGHHAVANNTRRYEETVRRLAEGRHAECVIVSRATLARLSQEREEAVKQAADDRKAVDDLYVRMKHAREERDAAESRCATLAAENNALKREMEDMDARLATLAAQGETLREALATVRDDYDCDRDAHRYGTVCRTCLAAAVIGEREGWSRAIAPGTPNTCGYAPLPALTPPVPEPRR